MTQFTTGNPLDPTCNTNLAGVENTDPSLSGVGIRCELTGEPIFSGYTPDPNVADAFQVHFNPAAFRRPRPSGGIGNLGNAPVGVLRHPSWWNWDFTLSRRIPVKVPGAARTGNVRIQLQLYNMWDAVQFTHHECHLHLHRAHNSVNNNCEYRETYGDGSTLAAGTITPNVWADVPSGSGRPEHSGRIPRL